MLLNVVTITDFYKDMPDPDSVSLTRIGGIYTHTIDALEKLSWLRDFHIGQAGYSIVDHSSGNGDFMAISENHHVTVRIITHSTEIAIGDRA